MDRVNMIRKNICVLYQVASSYAYELLHVEIEECQTVLIPGDCFIDKGFLCLHSNS